MESFICEQEDFEFNVWVREPQKFLEDRDDVSGTAVSEEAGGRDLTCTEVC